MNSDEIDAVLASVVPLSDDAPAARMLGAAVGEHVADRPLPTPPPAAEQQEAHDALRDAVYRGGDEA